MENENVVITPKKKTWKKVLLIVLTIVVFAVIVFGGYCLYKYAFPTDKEMFVQAHANLFKELDEDEEPGRFTNTTNISVEASGDFTSKKNAEIFETISVILENTKLSEENTEYNVTVNFLDQVFLTSNAVKSGDTEVLTIPQLSETSYGAESYEDVLTMLLGSEKAEDVEIFDGVDEDKFEDYANKYAIKIYNNVPDSDFSSQKITDGKVITLKSALDRVLYNTLNEIKNDKELRDFMYEQTKIVSNNINKKYPYAGNIVNVPGKDEYYENYEKNIDDFIKNIENSELCITTEIDGRRKIVKENIVILNNGKEQSVISYMPEEFHFVSYKEDVTTMEIVSSNSKNGTITNKKTIISFDINDFTKEKSEEQKMIKIVSDSITDTNVTKEIIMPETFKDIRGMNDNEKAKITEEASKNFVSLIASVTLELFSN